MLELNNFILFQLKLWQIFWKDTQKPILYIANIEENGADKNPWLEKIRSFLANENSQLIPICATVEAEVSELDDEDEKREFLKAMGMSEPGLDLIINAGYKLLGLQNYRQNSMFLLKFS